MNMQKEQMSNQIEQIQKKTAFDEDVIGCCISNFNDPRVCGRFRNTGCSQLVKCQTIKRIAI